MRKSVVAVGAALVAGTVLIAGCSKSGSGGSSGGADGKVAGGVPAPGGNTGFDTQALPADAGGGAASRAPATSLKITDPKALIRTAALAVTVEHGASVATQADKAAQLVLAAGGDVFADNRTAGDTPSASMTLKVPPDALTRVLGQLAALGKEQSRQVSTRDVTTEVADVDARLISARESIARLRTLYDRASKVSDVIAIEGELARRQADLESLEGQQRSLAAQTSMATVNLSLTTAPKPAKTHHDETGFLGGLAAGWRHFTAAASWVAKAVGAALPFAVLFVLVGAAVTVLRRRHPHPAVAPPAPTETG